MIRIVLVEPREAGNVGAAARVMKNFGVTELWVVGDHPQLTPVAGWWASGADDVVEAIRFAPTLAMALADAHVTVATTSQRGRTTVAKLNPETVAELYAGMTADQTLALVFGREDKGLTSEEVALCQRTASIPTNPISPTMNLAQSVGVFCYELRSTVPAETSRDLATAGTLERLHERAQSLLIDAGFLHLENPDRIYVDLRTIAGRAELDEREATILLGMIRQLEWKVRGRE